MVMDMETSITWKQRRWNWNTLIVLILFVGLPYATPLSISENVLKIGLFARRELLQTQNECSKDFENKNYTIITSRCKPPKYPVDQCCQAFKDFACPYADLLNDERYNCASKMFYYINLHGNYSAGLFANECVDGKDGLDCSTSQPNSAIISSNIHPFFTFIVGASVNMVVASWHFYLF